MKSLTFILFTGPSAGTDVWLAVWFTDCCPYVDPLTSELAPVFFSFSQTVSLVPSIHPTSPLLNHPQPSLSHLLLWTAGFRCVFLCIPPSSHHSIPPSFSFIFCSSVRPSWIRLPVQSHEAFVGEEPGCDGKLVFYKRKKKRKEICPCVLSQKELVFESTCEKLMQIKQSGVEVARGPGPSLCIFCSYLLQSAAK